MDVKIALAGNPNSGKTTLFNGLTGSNQFVGNWPGVTVEKKEGKLKKHEGVTVIDLPGVYSLSPYTLEEVVTRNYLITERPNVILNLVDGTNLERNLYLTTQLIELGLPVVVAINMMDVVRKNGDELNIRELSNRLGCPVFEISALKEDGIDEALQTAIFVAKENVPVPQHTFSGVVEHAIAHIEEATVHSLPEEMQRYYAVKLFERDEKVKKQLSLSNELIEHIEKDIVSAEKELDDDAESIITNERYIYIAQLLKGIYKKKREGELTTSDKIDKIVTNRFLALPIFACLMFLVYYVSITLVGTFTTNWLSDKLFGTGFTLFHKEVDGLPVLIERGLTNLNCVNWLKALVVNGIVKGVGSVLSFVPEMFVLFFFLAFLEACGYMSRIAFVFDRIFRKIGLSGKSFIPMLIGTGCSVPGIMASRTIENVRDRRMTVITTSFIPCGAKLPLIALIAGAFFNGAWWVAPSAYLLGILAVTVSGLILKKTKLFQGDPAPFVMELPPYHLPTLKNVLRSMWERGWAFIKKAATIILLFTVIIWTLSNFGVVNGTVKLLSETELENSFLGYFGKILAWAFVPLGFGKWQTAVASLTGLVAKENIVGTLAVLYGGTNSVYETLSSVLTPSGAFAFMTFNLLCAPCLAAVGAIKREMNSVKWTLFALFYQTVFAYVVSFIFNQLGCLFSGTGNLVGSLVAVALIVGIGFLVGRKNRKGAKK